MPEYAPSDEIINKDKLLYNLFSHHPDFRSKLASGYALNLISPTKINFKIDFNDGFGPRWMQYTPDEILANYDIRVEDIPAMLEPFEVQMQGYIPQLKFGFSDEYS